MFTKSIKRHNYNHNPTLTAPSRKITNIIICQGKRKLYSKKRDLVCMKTHYNEALFSGTDNFHCDEG